MSELNHFILENIREGTGWCEKISSRLALQSKENGVVQSFATVEAEHWRHYLPWFSTKSAALEKIVLKEMEIGNWSSAMVGKERKREFVPKVCIHGWLRGRLKRCLLETSCSRIQATQDVSFDMLNCHAPLSCSKAMSESAL